MTRTTRPRRIDLGALFPALRDHSRPATRLHPRPGTPTSADSSIGGPLLWPAGEPWPTCSSGGHDTDHLQTPSVVRRRRAILGAAWARTRRGQRLQLTEPLPPDTPVLMPREPIAMVPVAQLYRRDVPGFLGPDDTDLLQVLWCPLDHDDLEYCPRVELRRRRAADVTDVLTDPPQPPVGNEDYLPEPCVVHPEQIQEYQYLDLLPPDLAAAISAWDDDGAYFSELSVADGWKLGGFANWNLSDPRPMTCATCGTAMNLLLRAASGEWDGDGHWRPIEDDAEPEFLSLPARSNPTAVVIGRGYSLWIFYCPASFDHPHATALQ